MQHVEYRRQVASGYQQVKSGNHFWNFSVDVAVAVTVTVTLCARVTGVYTGNSNSVHIHTIHTCYTNTVP